MGVAFLQIFDLRPHNASKCQLIDWQNIKNGENRPKMTSNEKKCRKTTPVIFKNSGGRLSPQFWFETTYCPQRLILTSMASKWSFFWPLYLLNQKNTRNFLFSHFKYIGGRSFTKFFWKIGVYYHFYFLRPNIETNSSASNQLTTENFTSANFLPLWCLIHFWYN